MKPFFQKYPPVIPPPALTAVYIDFDRKKVDKANRRLIDLIKQRAPDYEHEAEGSHGDTV